MLFISNTHTRIYTSRHAIYIYTICCCLYTATRLPSIVQSITLVACEGQIIATTVMLIRVVIVGIHFAAAAYAPARIYVVVVIFLNNNVALTFVIVVVAAVDFMEFVAIFTIDFTYLFASVIVVRLMQLFDSNKLWHTVFYVNSIVVMFIAFGCCSAHFQAKHFTIIALTNCDCQFVFVLTH